MDFAGTDRRDRTIAWCLACLAPAAAAVSLLLLRSVWAVFALYQVTCCLLLPVLDTRLRGRRGWQDHLAALGLRRDRCSVRTAALGLGLGALTGVVVAGFLALTAEVSTPAQRLRQAMALWGISTAAWPWVLAFMLTIHVPAEELFWRGYVQTRLIGGAAPVGLVPRNRRRRPPQRVIARLALLSLLYASYHAVTLFALVPDRRLAGAMFVAVWAAGGFWGWLRWLTGGIWWPLAGHGGAVAAYVAFVPPFGG
jgi:membrane protease YdiL (CAAX protease family)